MKLGSYLKSLLVRYFDNIPLPERIENLEIPGVIVVSQESRMVTAALLNSFAKGRNFAQIYELPAGGLEQSSSYWLTLDRLERKDFNAAAVRGRKFITLNLIHGRGPLREQPSYRPSVWRSFKTLFSRKALIVDFGDPFEIAKETAQAIERSSKLSFYRTIKMYRGTPFQSRKTQARVVLGGHEFEREAAKLSTELNIPISKVKRSARREFYQLASNPNRWIYLALLPLARLIVNSLFSEVRTRGFRNFLDAAKNHPVALISMHRSHLDYIILGEIFYRSKVNTPLIAAGLNLSFWPFGFIIRSLGGYFVKRESKKDQIHSRVLQRYVTYLVKRGHSQEFFIEGGRSRSGRMLAPKLGLLSTLVGAYVDGLRKDVTAIPVSISYERVVEESVYGRENTGRAKEKENLFSLFKAMKIFRHKYSEVVVVFGEPISISAAAENLVDGLSSEQQIKQITSNLGTALISAIRNQVSPTLTSLSCAALLMAPGYALRQRDLVKALASLCNLLATLRRKGEKVGEFTPSLERFIQGEDTRIFDLQRSGIVSIDSLRDSKIFFIPGERRFSADFYKNGVIHLLFKPGVLSLLETLRGRISAPDLTLVHSIFQHEYLLSEKADFLTEIERLLKELEVEGSAYKMDDQWRVNRESELFIPAILLSSVQAHLWFRRNLLSPPSWVLTQGAEQKQMISTVEFFNFLKEKFRLASRLGGLSSTEASSKAALEGVLDSLLRRGLISLSFSPKGKRLISVEERAEGELQFLDDCNQALLSHLDSVQKRMVIG